MKMLYINAHTSDSEKINIDIIEKAIPSINKNECLIKISSSGVNPSDVLATKGYFKHAVLPRIPGRDFAGTVIEGPKHLIGKSVWGTGGAAGISSDGTQAEYIKLLADEVSEAPHNMDLITAGAQPLPYVTAYYSLVQRAQIQQNETVLVVGALGQVGRAAMSICHWKKCNPLALVRGTDEIKQARELGWTVINSEDNNLCEKILTANHGKPIQVILNSVGNIYWQDFLSSLDDFGRIVTIAARENVREATINLFDLYRANQEIIGVNTVSFNFSQNAKFLDELKTGFEANALTPLAVDKTSIYNIDQATEAYQAVLKGSKNRVVLKFSSNDKI